MRVKPLTPDEVRETLEATRDQIAMVDGSGQRRLSLQDSI